MLRTLRLALLAVVVLLVLAVVAYAVGRAQCPPPGWEVALFAPDGNWACVA